MKQVWIEDSTKKALDKYCQKYGTKMQTICTQAIDMRLKELNRQQKEMENK